MTFCSSSGVVVKMVMPFIWWKSKFQQIIIDIKQLLTFVEVNMFVCRPENPILTEAVAEVNIMDIQVCKQTY